MLIEQGLTSHHTHYRSYRRRQFSYVHHFVFDLDLFFYPSFLLNLFVPPNIARGMFTCLTTVAIFLCLLSRCLAISCDFSSVSLFR